MKSLNDLRTVPDTDGTPTTADELLDLLLDLHPEWHQRAACRGRTPLMFHAPEAAVLVCNSCRVRRECAEQATRDGERFGMWAGVWMEPRQSATRRLGAAHRLALMQWATDRPGEFSAQEAATAIGVSETSARRTLLEMVDLGVMRRRLPKKRGARALFRVRAGEDGEQ